MHSWTERTLRSWLALVLISASAIARFLETLSALRNLIFYILYSQIPFTLVYVTILVAAWLLDF
jgi:hypothetical protein